MNPLRSVGARLSLALLVVVAGALGVVYAFVVPSLESRLVHAKLAQLERSAPSLAREFDANPFTFDLTTAAATANARVVLYGVLSLSPSPELAVVDDSGSGDVADDRFALRTAISASMIMCSSASSMPWLRSAASSPSAKYTPSATASGERCFP